MFSNKVEPWEVRHFREDGCIALFYNLYFKGQFPALTESEFEPKKISVWGGLKPENSNNRKKRIMVRFKDVFEVLIKKKKLISLELTDYFFTKTSALRLAAFLKQTPGLLKLSFTDAFFSTKEKDREAIDIFFSALRESSVICFTLNDQDHHTFKDTLLPLLKVYIPKSNIAFLRVDHSSFEITPENIILFHDFLDESEQLLGVHFEHITKLNDAYTTTIDLDEIISDYAEAAVLYRPIEKIANRFVDAVQKPLSDDYRRFFNDMEIDSLNIPKTFQNLSQAWDLFLKLYQEYAADPEFSQEALNIFKEFMLPLRLSGTIYDLKMTMHYYHPSLQCLGFRSLFNPKPFRRFLDRSLTKVLPAVLAELLMTMSQQM